jgi:hypothetical protein
VCEALNNNTELCEMLSESPHLGTLEVYVIDFKPIATTLGKRYLIECHRVGERRGLPLRHVSKAWLGDEIPKFKTTWHGALRPEPPPVELFNLVIGTVKKLWLVAVDLHQQNLLER